MEPVSIGLISLGIVVTPEIKNVTLNNSGNTATLSAVVNPLGSGSMVASFKWGLTSVAGQQNVSNYIVPGGAADSTVTHTINNLLPGSTYFFNITAQNGDKSVSFANTFVTPSLVQSNISFPKSPTVNSFTITATANSATLTADVSPNGAASILFFDWGTTSANNFEHSSPIVNLVNNLWSTAPHAVTYGISGLQPGTSYDFRVTVLNSESGEPTTMTKQLSTN